MNKLLSKNEIWYNTCGLCKQDKIGIFGVLFKFYFSILKKQWIFIIDKDSRTEPIPYKVYALTVRYRVAKNLAKGTAQVTVRGIAGVDGGFYGQKVLKFIKIVEKSKA